MTKKYFDLMIDLETMGLPPNGALISIGAVFFDIHTETLGPTFSRTIHLGSAVAAGGQIDPGTVIWWLLQSDEARRAVAYGGEPIDKVLQEFSGWLYEHCRVEDVRPWGNGSSFDMTLLNSAFKQVGIPTPWKFWNERCFRTVRNMHPGVKFDPSKKGTGAHNALVDAEFQAQHLFAIKRAAKGVHV